jgi:hypothetical protein
MKQTDSQIQTGETSKKLTVTQFGCVSIIAPEPSPKAIQEQITANKQSARKLA